jgi:hypothetical protein
MDRLGSAPLSTTPHVGLYAGKKHDTALGDIGYASTREFSE